MLSKDQVAFYHEHGWLHIPRVYSPEETTQLQEALDWVIGNWAIKDKGWSGPWRQKYMDEITEKKSKLIALHDLQYYSQAWMTAVTNRRVAEAMHDLLDGPVEFHHSTLHVKPPGSGHPFPMHQDWPFYEHTDGRYVDVLVHLDDTRHENGEIRFLDGSHKREKIKHVTQTAEGPCTPHLPVDEYKLEETVAVPAKAGDLVLFNIYTIHGSYINTTDKMRRLVRVGYRHPENRQMAGQSFGRPGWMVWGQRERGEGDSPFKLE